MVYLGHLIHYWHTNITYGCSSWPDKETTTRRFNTVKEMSQCIVHNINHYVKKHDILIHLGDWSFGGIPNIWNFRKQLICDNIYIFPGNHDTHITKNIKLPNCIKVDDNIIVDGIPSNDNYVYVSSLFTHVFSNPIEKIFIDDEELIITHIPIDNFSGIHLHGHTHGNYPVVKNRLDVGIDNIFKLTGEYRPINWNELNKYL